MSEFSQEVEHRMGMSINSLAAVLSDYYDYLTVEPIPSPYCYNGGVDFYDAVERQELYHKTRQKKEQGK